jgi:predicted RNA binding protein YcfA (HicA-like mRNA interferase family)
MSITAKKMVKKLKKHGFFEKGQTGSHLKMFNPTTNKTVIVPIHHGDLPKGTEHSIYKQADIKK